MNYFFGIKTNNINSSLNIPRFENRKKKNIDCFLYQAEIINDSWKVKELKNNELSDDFYFVDSDILNNDNIFFLATKENIKKLEMNNFSKLENLNDFTDTTPAFRSNLQISLIDGGFSSYQSEYPYAMIKKQGSIVSSVSSIANKDADENFVFIKNIYEKPIKQKFNVFFVDIKLKEILNRYEVLTNHTNKIVIEKKFIKPEVFLCTDKFLGIPMYVSIKNKHLSFEHTHPPYSYILSQDKFKRVSNLKKEINEIIS